MTFRGPGGAVPPSLRRPGSSGGATRLPDEVLEEVDCIAHGTYFEVNPAKLTVLSVCQRPTNPCIVEIEYKVEGNGVYDLDEDLTLFSLDTVNGTDGTWHKLVPLRSDERHTTDFPAPDVPGGMPYDRITVEGEVTHRFVADMCDHVSTFMTDPKIHFLLVFRKADGFYGPGGGVLPGLR